MKKKCLQTHFESVGIFCFCRIFMSNKTLKQYSLEGEYLRDWNTMSEASKELGIAISSISLCCRGNYKKAGGFIWRIE